MGPSKTQPGPLFATHQDGKCMTNPTAKSVEIIDCKFSPVTYGDVWQWSRQILSSSSRGIITTVNVAILMSMRSNPDLKRFIDHSALTVADGQPIVWVSKLLRKPVPERVTGVDLIPGLCKAAAECHQPVYFLGSEPEVVIEVVRRMKQHVPHMIVAGIQHGYFPKDKTAEVIASINHSNAGLLFVGLGCPQQEAFLEEHWEQLNVKLAVPIGGAFDMLTDRKRRAPMWMREAGLEWLWRLYLEPRRLARRYAVSNSMFIWLSIKALVQNFLRLGGVIHST